MKRLMFVALFLIVSIVLAVAIAKKVSAQDSLPGLTEVSGFVCQEQSSAEAIGQAYEKGGHEVAGQTAQALAQAKKCGVLKETMWAIARQIKYFQYQGRVINLMEFDIDGTKVYGLLDKGEILA